MLAASRYGTRTLLCPRHHPVLSLKTSALRPPRRIITRVQNAASVGTASEASTPSNGDGAIWTDSPEPVRLPGKDPSPGQLPIPDSPLLPPAGILAKAVEMGTAKAKLPAMKCFIMAVMGGIFIAFGGLNGLPFGLLLVLVCGAELFTGNVALLSTAVFNGKATVKQLVRNWSISYVGNMIGTGLIIAMMCGGAVFPYQPPGLLKMAMPKVSLTFKQAFLRGILANWFVCLATWMAIGANSLISKIAGIYLTISAFVAIGLEHSVANMFIIPLAMAVGADISPSTYLLKNLLPVTLGNIVGGAIGVAGFYSYVYGTLGQKAQAA
ncbi:MAG: formate transporter [Trebouxia sp. A1-2]|nr:MAG: formate transporter [Trebouxia sp. A1-2]